MSEWADLELESALRRAFVRDEPADWMAVQHRVRRRRSRNVVRVAVLAGAATLLVVTQALGVTPGVGSLFGSSAPKPVKAGFTRMIAAGVDPSTIRLGAQVAMRDGRTLRLWTAHSTNPNVTCVQFQVDAGSLGIVGCGDVRPRTVGTWLMGSVENGRARPRASRALGGVAPPATTHVRLGFADGSSLVAKATGGAWAVEIPWAKQRYGHDLITVQPLDARGRAIATQHRPAALRPAHPVAPYVTVARVHGRPLRTAQGSGGTVCVDFHRADGIGIAQCNESGNGAGAWIVRLAQPGKDGTLVLLGFLPRNAAAARIAFANGRTLLAPRRHGVFVVELPGRPASRPIKLTFLTAGGDGVGSLSLRGPRGSGLYGPAWHGARYTKVTFGHMNSLDYVAGRLQWPDGHLTPARR